MELDLFVTPGLGDNSYLVTSGDEAAAIDPQRDVGRIVEAADGRGARIRYVVETHVHNDYVSGAAELRRAVGAEVVVPADAGYTFDVTPIGHGDEIAIGEARLVALATPGHTFEHTSYLLHEPGSTTPSSLFSGGSLIIGTAGRTDLLGPEHTDELTRLQYRTMRRLSELPDDVALLPTHGAGSFCATSPPGDRRTSSIGAERLGNPALAESDVARFTRQQMIGLPRYPRYYAHMAPINRAGPRVFGDVPLPAPRTVDEVAALLRGGAWLVDARDGASFAAAHVPGSLNVPLEPSFASYVGWLVPFDAPIVMLIPDAGSLVEASTQLFRIGYERLGGFLDGGLDAWQAGGQEVAAYGTLDVGDLLDELRRGDAGEVLDVRQPSEWEAGHLEGTRHLFVGDLPARLSEVDPRTRTTLVCASGYRSAMAASLLAREGHPVRLVPRHGVPRALRILHASA
ncbi:MAG TPA: MBL fold metallo-hydrolase [Actinomycetota bacterium]|jgi:glyoxylase-like metal-dependent hydrolase (beta-lactamase superfamily II)